MSFILLFILFLFNYFYLKFAVFPAVNQSAYIDVLLDFVVRTGFEPV